MWDKGQEEGKRREQEGRKPEKQGKLKKDTWEPLHIFNSQ